MTWIDKIKIALLGGPFLLITVLETLIQMYLSVGTVTFITFVFFLLFCGGFIFIVKKKHYKTLVASILLFFGSFAVRIYSVSDYIFLGPVIASESICESPGFSELNFYPHKCRISYGGILGSTTIIYTDYKLGWGEVLIDSNEEIYELEGHEIEIRGERYTIVHQPFKD